MHSPCHCRNAAAVLHGRRGAFGGHHSPGDLHRARKSPQEKKKVNLTKRIKMLSYSHEKFNGNKIKASANVVENPSSQCREI